MPQTPWAMAQSWHDLLFAHWPVPVEMIRPTLPPGLEVDTFDGQAWLSIVPFRMRGVRPKNLPGVPWLSNFAELNVRTYVHLPDPIPRGPTAYKAHRTRPGVFFYSLDAANPVAVQIARTFYHLPYFWAQMRCEEQSGAIHYASLRYPHGESVPRAVAGEFRAEYAPTGGIQPATPGTLEHWLAERYALYAADKRKNLYRGEIHHMPWPLQTAAVTLETNTLAPSVGLALPDTAPLLQFSRRLDVLIWPLQPVRASGEATSPAWTP